MAMEYWGPTIQYKIGSCGGVEFNKLVVNKLTNKISKLIPRKTIAAPTLKPHKFQSPIEEPRLSVPLGQSREGARSVEVV